MYSPNKMAPDFPGAYNLVYYHVLTYMHQHTYPLEPSIEKKIVQ